MRRDSAHGGSARVRYDSGMPAGCARSATLLGIGLCLVLALGGCAGGTPAWTPGVPSSSVAAVWHGAQARWFLDAPTIEVCEEGGAARRVLVPAPDDAGAEDASVAGWRQAGGDEGALTRGLADPASGTRVMERATAAEADDGGLLFERVIEVVELPAGLELSVRLPLSMRGPSADAGACVHRVAWAIHGAPLGAMWGEETHAVVLGRDEATRISLRRASPEARASQ